MKAKSPCLGDGALARAGFAAYVNAVQKYALTLRKKDAAFVYAILESLEGMAAFTTVSGAEAGPEQCVIQLMVPEGFEGDMAEVLSGLKDRITLDCKHF